MKLGGAKVARRQTFCETYSQSSPVLKQIFCIHVMNHIILALNEAQKKCFNIFILVLWVANVTIGSDTNANVTIGRGNWQC